MDFENDPAAEFLQRERAELADLINDNDSAYIKVYLIFN